MVGLQCVIVVFPYHIHLPFYRGMIYYKPFKGNLLKRNFNSANCFAIMHTLHGLYKMLKRSEQTPLTVSLKLSKYIGLDKCGST